MTTSRSLKYNDWLMKPTASLVAAVTLYNITEHDWLSPTVSIS